MPQINESQLRKLCEQQTEIITGLDILAASTPGLFADSLRDLSERARRVRERLITFCED